MIQHQLTFEDIDLLNEKELQELSDYFGNGYGGYSEEAVFEEVLPMGYSLKFIKELMSNRYLCMHETDEEFEKDFVRYKNSPILEYEDIRCKCCNQKVRTRATYYKRVGKYFNEKGDILNSEEW